MKKIIKLTESDITELIKRVISEQTQNLNPKNLKFGDGGRKNPKQIEDVKALQQKLIDLKLLKNSKGELITNPTGYFGPLTKAALERAQGQKTKTSETTLSDRQKNINSIYCNSEGGVVIAPNSQSNGMKWVDWVKKYNVTTNEIEIAKKSCSKVTKNYEFTPRIDRELKYIKMRDLDKTPFFIYDPKENLIYLFKKGGIMVDYTQVVDGADVQKTASPMTPDKWCQLSGFDITPYQCTDKTTKQRKSPYYSVLANTADRFIPKGIYSIGSLHREEGYIGAGLNTFNMVDENGKPISAAIHGIPNLPDRLTASKELEQLLNKDIQSGKVPKKYLNNIKAIANANRSFGCIGVPAKFVENKNVQALAKGAKVFIMGEQGDYLVQNSEDFFNKLKGNGQNCINPESLASRMSSTG